MADDNGGNAAAPGAASGGGQAPEDMVLYVVEPHTKILNRPTGATPCYPGHEHRHGQQLDRAEDDATSVIILANRLLFLPARTSAMPVETSGCRRASACPSRPASTVSRRSTVRACGCSSATRP
jgi:hypothetical protein